jgi:hypothetical protein
VRKFLPQIDLNILGGVGLEVAVTGLMKMEENGHDLAVLQFSLALALPSTARQLVRLPIGCNQLTKIIDMAEEFG